MSITAAHRIQQTKPTQLGQHAMRRRGRNTQARHHVHQWDSVLGRSCHFKNLDDAIQALQAPGASTLCLSRSFFPRLFFVHYEILALLARYQLFKSAMGEMRVCSTLVCP